jgi:hypothetical protein
MLLFYVMLHKILNIHHIKLKKKLSFFRNVHSSIHCEIGDTKLCLSVDKTKMNPKEIG